MTGNLKEKTIRGMQYTASIPERLIRSMTSIMGGMLKESTDFLVPEKLKETTTYRIFIGNLLRYGVENIGRVKGTFPGDEKMGNEYGVKKMVGNGMEVVGIVAVSASPLWVLALFSDALWGVDAYLDRMKKEFEQMDLFDDDDDEKAGEDKTESKKERVKTDEVKGEDKIESKKERDKKDEEKGKEAADGEDEKEPLLKILRHVSDSLATFVDTPPLSKQEFREFAGDLRSHFRELGRRKKVRKEDVQELWEDMEATAEKNKLTLRELSGTMTVHAMNRAKKRAKSGARRTGRSMKVGGKVGKDIVHEDLMDYYRDALKDIREQGYGTVVKHEFHPYLKSAKTMFSPEEKMLTERILSRETVEFFGKVREKRKEKREERKEEKRKRLEEEEREKEGNGRKKEENGSEEKGENDSGNEALHVL